MLLPASIFRNLLHPQFVHTRNCPASSSNLANNTTPEDFLWWPFPGTGQAPPPFCRPPKGGKATATPSRDGGLSPVPGSVDGRRSTDSASGPSPARVIASYKKQVKELHVQLAAEAFLDLGLILTIVHAVLSFDWARVLGCQVEQRALVDGSGGDRCPRPMYHHHKSYLRTTPTRPASCALACCHCTTPTRPASCALVPMRSGCGLVLVI